MAEWLIADITLRGVHLQVWTLLVAGFMVVWFLYAWATR